MGATASVELKAITGEFIAKMKEAGTEVEHLSTKGASSFDKLASFGKAAFLGIATGALGVATESIHLADTFEKAHARLEGAITNAGGNFDEFSGRIAATEKTMEGFGHTNADTEEALAMLTNATHDTGKAIEQMQIAANIAAGRNISLSEATGILMKVNTGHVALLGRLGIATKDVNGKTIDQATALKKLSDMYGGDASRQASTFAGKTTALKTQLEDVGAKIGLALIPVILDLVGVVTTVVDWFGKHKDVAYALAAVIGGVLTVSIAAWGVELATKTAESVGQFATWVAGLFTVTAAEEATTVASEEMGVATTTALGPIGLALAALGVAAYELYKHWDTVWGGIKNIAVDAWHFIDDDVVHPIEAAFGWVVDQVKAHWDLIFGILTGPIGLAAAEIYKHWNAIESFFSDVASKIASVWSDTWHAVGDALKFVWDHTLGPILDTIKSAIDGVSSALSKAAGAIKDIGGVAGKIGNAVNPLNWFADGTDYAPGGMAVVGERGPELVHLPRGSQVIPNHKIGSGMTLHQTNHYYGTQVTGNDVARDTAWKLRVGALAS